MPSNALLASAVKPACPVTRAVSSPCGTSRRNVATSRTTSRVSSLVVSTLTSAVEPSSDTWDGGVSGARPPPSSPHALAYGVVTALRSRIAPESHSERASASICATSASVSPPGRW